MEIVAAIGKQFCLCTEAALIYKGQQFRHVLLVMEF